jgi:hypothetical protein
MLAYARPARNFFQSSYIIYQHSIIPYTLPGTFLVVKIISKWLVWYLLQRSGRAGQVFSPSVTWIQTRTEQQPSRPDQWSELIIF